MIFMVSQTISYLKFDQVWSWYHVNKEGYPVSTGNKQRWTASNLGFNILFDNEQKRDKNSILEIQHECFLLSNTTIHRSQKHWTFTLYVMQGCKLQSPLVEGSPAYSNWKFIKIYVECSVYIFLLMYSEYRSEM